MMNENITTLKQESCIEEATKAFFRYGFRSLPVIYKDNKMVGIVSQRDVMKLTLHFLE
jgi:CBS domain-containing protein